MVQRPKSNVQSQDPQQTLDFGRWTLDIGLALNQCKG
jgi:hypothetical protein